MSSEKNEKKQNGPWAIKIATDYEQDGEQRTRFETVGWLNPAPADSPVAFFINIPLLPKLLAFKRDDKREDKRDGQQ